MEIDPIEPSQRQKDSEDDNVDAVVEAVVKQVSTVEKQADMIVGPSQPHKKRRVLKELLQSGGVAPRTQLPQPSTLPSSSSHGLNEVASVVARKTTVPSGPIAATQGEPPEQLQKSRLLQIHHH